MTTGPQVGVSAVIVRDGDALPEPLFLPTAHLVESGWHPDAD